VGDVALETRGVDIDHPIRDAHLLVRNLDRVVERTTKLVERVPERLARLVLVALTPEQRRQLVARHGLRSAPSDVREEDELLAAAREYVAGRTHEAQLAEREERERRGRGKHQECGLTPDSRS